MRFSLANGARLCLAGSAMLCSVQPAQAQISTGSVDGPGPSLRLRLGAVTVTPSVALRTFGVDTNVFNTPDNRKSDVTFTVDPGAKATLDLRRLQVSLTGGARYLYFRRYETERALNPYAGGQATLQWGRHSSVAAGVSWADTKDRLNFEVDQRVRNVTRSANVGASLGVSRRLAFDISLARTETEFDGDATFRGVSLRHTLDRTSDSASLSARYKASNLTTFGVTATITADRFQFQTVRNTDLLDARLESTFQPRALISGRASVGYMWTRPLDPLLPDYSGPTAGVEIFFMLLEATEFGVFVEREREYSFSPWAPYYVLNRYGGSVRRHLFRRVDAYLRAERFSPAYRSLVADEAAPLDGHRRDAGHRQGTSRYAASLGVQAARDMRVSLDADYFQAAGGPSSSGRYDGWTMGISVQYGFLTVGGRGAR